jgi:hypothetical protein
MNHVRVDTHRAYVPHFCCDQTCQQSKLCPLRETEAGCDVAPDASRSFSGSLKAARGLGARWATLALGLAATLGVAALLGWIAWCIQAAWGFA